jgi:hypothetical protein
MTCCFHFRVVKVQFKFRDYPKDGGRKNLKRDKLPINTASHPITLKVWKIMLLLLCSICTHQAANQIHGHWQQRRGRQMHGGFWCISLEQNDNLYVEWDNIKVDRQKIGWKLSRLIGIRIQKMAGSSQLIAVCCRPTHCSVLPANTCTVYLKILHHLIHVTELRNSSWWFTKMAMNLWKKRRSCQTFTATRCW